MSDGALTEWEKEHLEDIVLLWKQAETAIVDFRDKEKDKRSEDIQQNWPKFASIVSNLYSVLDYTYHILCCHLSYQGEGAPDKEAIRHSFPYKAQGVQTSDTPNRDQTKTFVNDTAKQLCKSNSAVAKEIAQEILSLQPKVKVDANGHAVGDPEVPEGDAQWLAMLHFYRNRTTHRELIRFLPQRMWVECGVPSAAYKLVGESEKQQGHYYYPLEGDHFVIELPGNIPGNQKLKLLLHVLDGMRNLVRRICTDLLERAGVPPPVLPDGMFNAIHCCIHFVYYAGHTAT